MKITKENEAEEIVKVFMRTPIDFHPYATFGQIVDKMIKHNSVSWIFGAIYHLGYVHGIQAERKRRSGGKCIWGLCSNGTETAIELPY